jgi:predicted nucleotidyltransferase
VTDEEFLSLVVDTCRRAPRCEAVALGGSRARGDHRPDSDWDFAVYYRGELDVGFFERLGWPGTVYRPFDWGQVMYGGAVFDLDGRHFDIHYRNLDVVEHWTEEAEAGRFEVHILAFHLAGIPSYMLTGELATNRALWGSLPRPKFPDALRSSAPRVWLERAAAELGYARFWAMTANPVGCAGALARVVLQCAHARLAARGIWALNEKRMVQAAGLTVLDGVFARLGSSTEELGRAIGAVEEAHREVARELGEPPALGERNLPGPTEPSGP